jgi:hypothetical protein
MHSSGRPLISPQTLSGFSLSRAAVITRLRKRRIAGLSQSYRSARRGSPRSAANRNCVRSLVAI